MGGPGRPFPTTIWGMISGAADPLDPDQRRHLDRLVAQYWKPAYCYLRACGVRSVEDAKDLTQEFFSRLLEKGTVGRVDPRRGSFRSFLMRALRNFAIDAHRRGKGGPVFAIDECRDAETRIEGKGPEAEFRREWVRSVLSAALDELASRSKGDAVEVFRSYCLGDSDETYAELGKRLGLSESDVRNRISKCRRELREIVREKVREYVGDDRETETEFRLIVNG